MTVSINQVNTATNYLADWVTITNQVVAALANNCITANNSAGGQATVGNSFLQGIFAASNLQSNTIGGGNVTSSSNLTLISNLVTINSSINIISGICTVNSTTVSVGANVLINATSFFIGNTTINTFANSSQLSVVNFSIANSISTGNSTVNSVLSSVSLTIGTTLHSALNISTTGTSNQVVDSWATSTYRGAEYVLCVVDNSANNQEITKIMGLFNGSITEFGTILSNSAIGTFQGFQNTTSFILTFTPVSTSTTIKGNRILITV